MFKVTIGIPTFNRSIFLHRLLTSIEKSAKHVENLDLRIIIVDNCSTDNTKEVVDKWESTLNITYVRNSKNTGMIRNIMKVTEYYAGDGYFWFMGDDDQLEEPTFLEVDSKISKFKVDSFILINRYKCDSSMNKLKPDKYLKIKGDRYFDVSSEENLKKYFDCVNHAGGMFGLLTSTIVPQSFMSFLNENIKEDTFWLQNLFPHTYFIFKYMVSNYSSGAGIQYLSSPLILFRGGVNSKSSQPRMNALVDFDDFLAILISVFKTYKLRKAFKKMVTRHYSIRMHLSLVSETSKDVKSYHKAVFNDLFPCLSKKIYWGLISLLVLPYKLIKNIL